MKLPSRDVYGVQRFQALLQILKDEQRDSTSSETTKLRETIQLVEAQFESMSSQ